MFWTWLGRLQILIFSLLLVTPRAFAENISLLPGKLVSQLDGDEAYDPFADYSEFEESADEEADMNFFKNGRFFTVGLIIGWRGFTNDYDRIWGASPNFGIFLSYFFDLKFALALGYSSSDHIQAVRGPSENLVANVNIQSLDVQMRYYLITQNVTKGLAPFNPYVIAGLTRFTRMTKLSGSPAGSSDGAMGFDAGMGMEIPLMRNKMFLGAQAYYQYVQWPDEGVEIMQSDNTTSGVAPKGDTYTAMGIIGINF